MQSNHDGELGAMFAKSAAYGLAMSRGKDVFVNMGADLFGVAMRDERVDEDTAASWYDDVREHAEYQANLAHAPLKPQTDKSKASQRSKLGNFGTLGMLARTNDAIEPAIEYARKQAKGKYTPYVKCAVALKASLAKGKRTLADLIGAVDVAMLPGSAETASEAVSKLCDAFHTLAFGDAKGNPSPFEDAFSALDTTPRGNGLAAHAVTLLGNVRDLLKREEEAHKPLQSETDAARASLVADTLAKARERVEAGEFAKR